MMSTIDSEIANLEREIEQYRTQLNDQTITKEKMIALSNCIAARYNLLSVQLKLKFNVQNELKPFEYYADDSEAFPDGGCGTVIFQREWFINKTVEMVLTKGGSKFSSYYWRAPFGSGKTVFLKLMGKILQERGCDVYELTPPQLHKFHQNFFSQLAKEAGNKTVVLLIDQVQNNAKSSLWNAILKGSKPANLLVLGVGIPQLDFAPQFDKKIPSEDEIFPMFLTHEDLPEICSYFEKSVPTLSKESISNVCKSLLVFTAGHIFPFVTFMTDILDPNRKIDLENLDVYLSSQEFYSSLAYSTVKKSCFPYLSEGFILREAKSLMRNNNQDDFPKELEKDGSVDMATRKIYLSAHSQRNVFGEHSPPL